jgi:hypothetical protein
MADHAVNRAVLWKLMMPHWLVVVLVLLFVGVCMAIAWPSRKKVGHDKDDSGVWTGGDGMHHGSD